MGTYTPRAPRAIFLARRQGCSLIALLGASLLATPTPAQPCDASCTDSTKPCVCLIDPVDARVTLTPFGTVTRELAQVGRALDPGDQLLNLDDGAIVEIVCPAGSEIKLHGQFHTIVQPSGTDRDCVFNLLAGNADVLATKPTELQAGETIMGSVSTQYGMHVWRDDRDLNVECTVFEGDAVVRYGDRWRFDLSDSSKANWAVGRIEPDLARVTTADIDATSMVYARADLARLQRRGETPADPQALLRDLNATYAQVLTRPKDVPSRVQMAELQTKLNNPSQGLYHLQRAEKLQPAQDAEKATIASLKYTVLTQLGREEEAQIEIGKVRQLNPALYRERVRIQQ